MGASASPTIRWCVYVGSVIDVDGVVLMVVVAFLVVTVLLSIVLT
jgi:hypothetical protein